MLLHSYKMLCVHVSYRFARFLTLLWFAFISYLCKFLIVLLKTWKLAQRGRDVMSFNLLFWEINYTIYLAWIHQKFLIIFYLSKLHMRNRLMWKKNRIQFCSLFRGSLKRWQVSIAVGISTKGDMKWKVRSEKEATKKWMINEAGVLHLFLSESATSTNFFAWEWTVLYTYWT